MQEKKEARERAALLWNMAGSLVYALTSMLLGVAVTRLSGEAAGGIFFFAFSTLGQQLYIISYFGMRPLQVTDSTHLYSFGDYRRFRIITGLLAGGAGLLYGLLSTVTPYVRMVWLLLSLYKILDGFADVYESEMQRQGRLDMTGKATLFRTLFSVGVFLIGLRITGDLLWASALFIPAICVAVVLFSVLPLRGLSPECRVNKGSSRALFGKSKWLFLGSFLDLYIFAAAKYAVNDQMGEVYSNYFSTIFIPTSVINLMAGFVIRPILTKLSLLYKTGRRGEFIRLILQIGALIGGFTLLGVGAAALFGIPVLKLAMGAAGEALTPYTPALVLVVLGGGLYALLNLEYYILVILEMQGVIFLMYGAGALLAWGISEGLVRGGGVQGAALAYLLTMLLMALMFLGAVLWGIFFKESK